MQIHLPLDEMSISDKLDVMETLWTDLTRQAASVPSPDWHRDVLIERRRLAESGELRFLDWEVAFRELRDEVGGDPPA